MSRYKIAFVKYGGLNSAGTERWLQLMAAHLPKDKFEVDFYYSDIKGNFRSFFNVPKSYSFISKHRKKILDQRKIKLIEFKVPHRRVSVPTLDFIGSNFFSIFDETKYDLIQTAKSGFPEYPFYLLKKTPVVEYISLPGAPDHSKSIIYSVHLSNWQRNRWIKNGGCSKLSTIIPIPVDKPKSKLNLRLKLKIPKSAIVAGFHQRPDNSTVSDIPLKAFKNIFSSNLHFIILGGGNNYRYIAKNLNLKNIHFLNASSDPVFISKFLNTLDIFAHGRKDGETFGTVLAEAMIHGLPCISHHGTHANAQGETMGSGGFFVSNVTEYTKVLKKLVSSTSLRKKMGAKGKKYAYENYLLEPCVEKLANLYLNILKNKKRLKSQKRKYSSYRYLLCNKKPRALFLKIYYGFFVFISKLRFYFKK